MAKIGIQDRLTDDFLPFREVVPHGDIVIHSWTREELDGLHVEVIAYDTQVFSVNVESRMELRAKVNTIYVSENIYMTLVINTVSPQMERSTSKTKARRADTICWRSEVT